MLAVFIARPGGSGVVSIRESPPPRVGSGQVLVRVRAAGVNFADVVARTGLYPDAPRFPFVPGYEFAGVVEGVERTSMIRPGERVLGLSLFGAQAEYVAVGENQLFPMPDTMSFEEAAAIPVNYLTAYYALFILGNLRSEERVLIHSAAGGVGTAAVQLARTRTTEVVGTVGATEKLDYLRQIGVKYPVDRNREDFEQSMRQRLDGRGIDLVLDPLGGPVFRKSYRLLAPGGRIVCYGVMDLISGGRRNLPRLIYKYLRLPRVGTLNLIQGNKGVFGLSINRLLGRIGELRAAMTSVIDLYEKGRVKPMVSRIFPASDAGKAYEFLESGQSIGKLILRFSD